MLQNPQWDFYSLVGLRDWLARQPADGTYDWPSPSCCVVGRYLTESGQEPWDYYSWIKGVDAGDFAYACFGRASNFGAALANLDRWIAGERPPPNLTF